VIAIGDLFGIERTLTTGGALQTDAPINTGNSDGLLLNAASEVIGVTPRSGRAVRAAAA
jgi:S1-C subfamily serine protease